MSDRVKQIGSDDYEVAKGVIFDALRKANITEVRVNFDGSGDEGQFDDLEAFNDGTPVDFPELKISLTDDHEDNNLREAIEEMCLDFLENTHAGWEVNEGSEGEFRFDVTNGTIILEFNERYIAVNSETNTF
jgi:hypothetical protein